MLSGLHVCNMAFSLPGSKKGKYFTTEDLCLLFFWHAGFAGPNIGLFKKEKKGKPIRRGKIYN